MYVEILAKEIQILNCSYFCDAVNCALQMSVD